MSSYSVTFVLGEDKKTVPCMPSLNAALSVAKNRVCWPDVWSDEKIKGLVATITNDHDGTIAKTLTYAELR